MSEGEDVRAELLKLIQAREQEMAETLRAARTGERIRSTMSSLRPIAEDLPQLAEFDPDLAPEILACAELLADVVSTLQRAFTFTDERYKANVAKIRDTAGLPPLKDDDADGS